MIKKTKAGNWIHFEVYSVEPITREEAARMQIREGYIPQGYGFEAFKCERVHPEADKPEYYRATWKCYSSCD